VFDHVDMTEVTPLDLGFGNPKRLPVEDLTFSVSVGVVHMILKDGRGLAAIAVAVVAIGVRVEPVPIFADVLNAAFV